MNNYMYYGYGLWPFGFVGGILQVVFWIFIVSLIIRIIRGRRWRDRDCRWRDWLSGSPAEEILRERYTKGEISKEEYEERLKVLRGHDAHHEKKS